MKQNVLSRYGRNEDDRVIIDVSAEKVEDLYNNFDRSSPYIRRDLDKDLADYLTSCVRELIDTRFTIRFTLSKEVDEHNLSRVRKSIKEYFIYLQETERRSIFQMFRRSAVLFTIGLSIMFVSVSVNKMIGDSRSVGVDVLAQGLTVAAWVSLWEATAVFLIGWFPSRKKVLVCRRIVEAEILFRIKAP